MSIEDDLEHDSGLRPVGEYRDHCATCGMVADMRERQASCEHGSFSQVRTFSGLVVHRWCDDCGLTDNTPETN